MSVKSLSVNPLMSVNSLMSVKLLNVYKSIINVYTHTATLGVDFLIVVHSHTFAISAR